MKFEEKQPEKDTVPRTRPSMTSTKRDGKEQELLNAKAEQSQPAIGSFGKAIIRMKARISKVRTDMCLQTLHSDK